MDWQYIESVFHDEIPFTQASNEEIFDSLLFLEKEFGLEWITYTKKTISNSQALSRLICFSECYKVTDKISDGKSLKKKLRNPYQSKNCQDAIAEALIAERLLSSGAIAHYEPIMPGIKIRPDFLACWNEMTIAFEVTFPNSSYFDDSEDNKVSELLSQCQNFMNIGTLNIYLLSSTLTPEMSSAISDVVMHLSTKQDEFIEMDIKNIAYINFSKFIAVKKIQDEKQGISNENAFPMLDSFYHEIKKRLKIISPTRCLVGTKIEPQNTRFLETSSIIRIYRPLTDNRVWQKVNQEYKQLPENIPGIIVIDMSRTSMHTYPEQWAMDISNSFIPDIYSKLSAVWLRSGFPMFRENWNEQIISNPYSKIRVPVEVLKRMLFERSKIP